MTLIPVPPKKPVKEIEFNPITGEYIGNDPALIGTNIKGWIKLMNKTLCKHKKTEQTFHVTEDLTATYTYPVTVCCICDKVLKRGKPSVSQSLSQSRFERECRISDSNPSRS